MDAGGWSDLRCSDLAGPVVLIGTPCRWSLGSATLPGMVVGSIPLASGAGRDGEGGQAACRVPGWSRSRETPNSHPCTCKVVSCPQPTSQNMAAGLTFICWDGLPGRKASRVGLLSMHAVVLEKTRRDSTSWFETTLPGICKLSSSESTDLLSVVFIMGILLLEGHLWKALWAESGPLGMTESPAPAPSSVAPRFVGGRWVRRELEANDALGLQGGREKDHHGGLGCPACPVLGRDAPQCSASLPDRCRNQPREVPAGSFGTELCRTLD